MYCGECKQECEVERHSDEDGDEIMTMQINWISSECCDAQVFLDEACTKPLEYDQYDDTPTD